MTDRDDETPPIPVVTGAPDVIYLCVGDLEHNDTFSAIEYTGEVTWCADKQGASDIKYVRADLAARAAPAQSGSKSNAESVGQTRNMVPGKFPMHAGGITGNDLAPAQPRREPTSCGYCEYEEADGSLIEQCPKCKAKDAAPAQPAGEAT